MPEAEIIGADDLILSVRVASYEGKTLSRPIDLPLPRTTTVQLLYEAILIRFPRCNEEPPSTADNPVVEEEGDNSANAGGKDTDEVATLSRASSGGVDGGGGEIVEVVYTAPPTQSRFVAVAKGLTSGPPLTLKSALKLKWNDNSVLRRADCLIDHPPLNLRDGSVLIVRGVADFERAKAAVRARRELEGPRPVSAGTGAVAVKANRAVSRGGKQFPSALPREKGSHAKTSGEGGDSNSGNGNGEAPPPPHPSPDKAKDMGLGLGITGARLPAP